MKRRSPSEWQALIEEQAESGLTAVEFCRQRGLNDKYFSLRKQHVEKTKADSSGFMVARLAPSGGAIEVRVGRAIISVPASQPAVWLADFVKALA